MALYRFEAKIFARENQGRSVVAASAYRSGGKLKDERSEKTHDYSRRTKTVIETVILRPQGAPDWAADPEQLWNNVERSEKRKDARLAREFVLAMPVELDAKEQMCLAVGWAQSELVDKGMAAEVSLHHDKDGKNPHVHILCPDRKFAGDAFSSKKVREWNSEQTLHGWRESWCRAVNAALEKAGIDARVDHRSLKDQGIERIPEPKIGVAATAMKRKGIDTLRHQAARFAKSLNFVRAWMKSIEKTGEVEQHGMGATWWERSLILVSKARESVRETVMDTWRNLQNKPADHDPGAPPWMQHRDMDEPER